MNYTFNTAPFKPKPDCFNWCKEQHFVYDLNSYTELLFIPTIGLLLIILGYYLMNEEEKERIGTGKFLILSGITMITMFLVYVLHFL